jgi:hypothetical protein
MKNILTPYKLLNRPCIHTTLLLRSLSTTSITTTSGSSSSSSSSSSRVTTLPTKRMNLFTAVNDAMRVSLQTDPTAIVLGEGN